jgi:hypothetical protein
MVLKIHAKNAPIIAAWTAAQAILVTAKNACPDTDSLKKLILIKIENSASNAPKTAALVTPTLPFALPVIRDTNLTKRSLALQTRLTTVPSTAMTDVMFVTTTTSN